MQNCSYKAWVIPAVMLLGLLDCRGRGEAHRQEPVPRGDTSIVSAGKDQANPARVPELTVPQLANNERILIDGKLSEPCWAHSATTGEFVNAGSGTRDVGLDVGGRAYLLWTSEALYIAFIVRDTDIKGDFEKGAVDPHLWTENTTETMIDPDGDGDNRDYYEIQIGPQNLVFDSRFDDYNQPRSLPAGPFGHQDWTAHATTAVALNGTLNNSSDRDQGYTVEAKVPWSAFDKARTTPPKLGDQWRMNFYAMRNNGGVAWSPILGQGNFHKASRFGKVTWAGP